MHPGAVEGAAHGVCHALRIDVIYPRSPKHTESACGSAEEPRAVGDLVPDFVALLVALAAPWRVAGAEQDFRLSHRAAEVGLQLDLLDGAVPVLKPFSAEDEIWLAVCVAPECAVERRPVGGQVGGISEGAVRPHGIVGAQHLRCAPLDDIAAHGVNLHGLVGERGEIVVPAVARRVELRSPDHRALPHP